MDCGGYREQRLFWPKEYEEDEEYEEHRRDRGMHRGKTEYPGVRKSADSHPRLRCSSYSLYPSCSSFLKFQSF